MLMLLVLVLLSIMPLSHMIRADVPVLSVLSLYVMFRCTLGGSCVHTARSHAGGVNTLDAGDVPSDSTDVRHDVTTHAAMRVLDATRR